MTTGYMKQDFIQSLIDRTTAHPNNLLMFKENIGAVFNDNLKKKDNTHTHHSLTQSFPGQCKVSSDNKWHLRGFFHLIYIAALPSVRVRVHCCEVAFHSVVHEGKRSFSSTRIASFFNYPAELALDDL